ncbi:hypothetical protein JCM1841_003172 [Sporobolomyces salmonicolor]
MASPMMLLVAAPTRATAARIAPHQLTRLAGLSPSLGSSSLRSLHSRAFSLVQRTKPTANPLDKLVRTRPFSRPFSWSSFRGSSSAPSPVLPADTSSLPVTQRLKILFRTHGWSALAIYLLLSAVDFGLTFLLIYAVGADRVRDAEDWVLDTLGWRRKHAEAAGAGAGAGEEKGRLRQAVDRFNGAKERLEGQKAPEVRPERDQPVEAMAPVAPAAQKREAEKGYSAYATTAVLAYAIHKTALLPVRVGITVAITPKVVRMLRGWGWNVGNAGAAGAAAKSQA